MTDSHEPFWQNMLAKSARKFSIRQGHFLFFTAFSVIFVAKTNFFIRHFFDSVVADGDFVRVFSQIFNLEKTVKLTT